MYHYFLKTITNFTREFLSDVLLVVSFQINSPAAVPLISPVIYGPDGRILSAAPPGFIPGPPYGSETEQIDICPFFAQGKCINQMCPLVHPGMCIYLCV